MTLVPPGAQQAHADGGVVVQSNGTIVLAGDSSVGGATSPWYEGLARLKSNGQPDSAFGNAGFDTSTLTPYKLIFRGGDLAEGANDDLMLIAESGVEAFPL